MRHCLLTPERHRVAARHWFDAQDEDRLTISHWVEAEIASALAMKVRRGVLTAPERARTWAKWQDAIATRLRFADVQVADFRHVAHLVDAGMRGLRAGDTLHLAAAARQRCAVATLDDDLAEAARAIGLDAPEIRGSS